MIGAPLDPQAGAVAPGQVPVAPAPAPDAFVPGAALADTGAALDDAAAQASALTAPPYAGGTPEGSLTSTPRQAAADLLNSGETKKGLATAEGDINAREQNEIASIQSGAAAEKLQQATDFQNHFAQADQGYNEELAQSQTAYDKHKASAGTLKDPEEQFYEDKGQGYRVETALAAFAAGIGAGFNGQAEPGARSAP